MIRLDDGAAPILARPEHVSVDQAGRYVITDISDKAFKLYDASGKRVGTVGRVGHGPGEFAALMTGDVYRDSLVGYDLDGARLSVFAPDGRFTRAFSLAARNRAPPFLVRVVDDSLLLVIGSVMGAGGRNLLTLLRADGTEVSSFFSAREYFGEDPALAQLSAVLADARDGLVYAAIVGGDSLWVFDYAGKRVASHPVDPVQPLVTTKSLLRRNGGRPRRSDGSWVVHENRNVIGLVALDSASVAVQMAPYDTKVGTDPIDGGTLIVAAVGRGGRMHTLARSEMSGGLLGRDRAGRPLLLRYTSPDVEAYEIVQMRLAASSAPTVADYDSATQRVSGRLAPAAAAVVRDAVAGDEALMALVRGRDLLVCEDLGRQLRELQRRAVGNLPLVVLTEPESASAVEAFLRRERVRARVAVSPFDHLLAGHAAPPTPAVLVTRDGSAVEGTAHPRRFANARVRSFADELAPLLNR